MYLTSYVIRELQINTMRYHNVPTRMKRKQLKIPNVGEDAEQQKLSVTAGGDASGAAHVGDSSAVPCESKHALTAQSRNQLLCIYPNVLKIYVHINPSHKYLQPFIHNCPKV